MKKYVIECATYENIFCKAEACYDGACRDHLCEWETIAEYENREEAVKAFNKDYAQSEYLENYKHITEYELVEQDDESADVNIIAESKL